MSLGKKIVLLAGLLSAGIAPNSIPNSIENKYKALRVAAPVEGQKESSGEYCETGIKLKNTLSKVIKAIEDKTNKIKIAVAHGKISDSQYLELARECEQIIGSSDTDIYLNSDLPLFETIKEEYEEIYSVNLEGLEYEVVKPQELEEILRNHNSCIESKAVLGIYDSKNKKVYLKDSLTPLEGYLTLIHEIAHASFKELNKGKGADDDMLYKDEIFARLNELYITQILEEKGKVIGSRNLVEEVIKKGLRALLYSKKVDEDFNAECWNSVFRIIDESSEDNEHMDRKIKEMMSQEKILNLKKPSNSFYRVAEFLKAYAELNGRH